MPVDNPSGVPVAGPGAPYITPVTLTAASTGIAWSTIGGPGINLTPAQQLAEQTNICARATAMVDSCCNQPLRATVDVETAYGPGGFRCQNQPTGVTRILLSRSPVLSVVSGQVSSAGAFPRSWQAIAADQFAVERPPVGVYGTTAPGASGDGGQAVLLAPGYVTWGRLSSVIEVTYVNGWPHAALTSPAAAAASSVDVDDITGWYGAAGNIYDGQFQEFVSVTAVAPVVTGAISGPGTLTLSTGLTFPHQEGTLVSTLSATVEQACIYFAVSEALTKGATATTVQSISGGSSGSGPSTQKAYEDMAKLLVHSYRRVL
jgi:hypothetical protein